MNPSSRRMPFVNTLKALASQLIVLHHLAFYGPMSDVAYPLATTEIDWLYEYGRMAVQIFLVVAGFLAIRGLAPAANPIEIKPLHLIWSRYQRLALPLFAALVVSIASAALAHQWIEHPSIPDPPTLAQILAHALLLQNVVGQEALSAGVWYVAIDFQLFIMLVLCLWLANKHHQACEHWAVQLIGLLALASLFYFNRREGWDNWGIYFFGSYALGVVSYWSSRREYSPAWFMVIAGLVVSALLLEFRLRIAIALCTALSLGLFSRFDLMGKWPDFRLTAWLGKISYSVFLIHFPVCLLVNAAVFHFAPDSPRLNLAGMLVAWLLSIGAGNLFYRYIESRIRIPRLTGTQGSAVMRAH